ncbi:MAG: AAA family ATPase, partial [bacterium]|nr:AAA family ATPase [bacterium]
MILKRFSQEHIETWFKRRHRKPLVIRGARQVGKSTLVRSFAQNNDLTLHEINLERHPQLATIFDTLDITRILKELEHISGKGKINTSGNKHLLFLDEIQAVPSAIKALRYFYEDFPGLAVIAAGSL